ncbi:MAG TPA: LacI family DNA-binding transcriptional regulator [Thermoanaerobaculia bacterium]|nr:LacI family DNA-binding transcriptional regulator [Thermoanaerobaculia bacterium]
MSTRRQRPKKNRGERLTLKDLASHLDLSPATISLVLNHSPVAAAIPEETQQRVFAAARELGYRPNYIAVSLRSQRTNSIGVLVPEVSDPWAAEIVSGIESHLLASEYHYLLTSHRRSTPKLLQDDLELLTRRAVDGMILVATELREPPLLPTVVISGHTRVKGLSNVVINHDHAARAALAHLKELGHRRIALFRGQPGSSDTEDRARAIFKAAAALGVEIPPELTLQLSGEGEDEIFAPDAAYQEGYAFGQKLLTRRLEFTALFAFDDASAIGAIRAFLDAGLHVPEDVSVVGFDDIQNAAYYNPRLTTVRQPLREMGRIAARVLLERINASHERGARPEDSFVVVEPELVVRDSTGPARAMKPKGRTRR